MSQPSVGGYDTAAQDTDTSADEPDTEELLIILLWTRCSFPIPPQDVSSSVCSQGGESIVVLSI